MELFWGGGIPPGRLQQKVWESIHARQTRILHMRMGLPAAGRLHGAGVIEPHWFGVSTQGRVGAPHTPLQAHFIAIIVVSRSSVISDISFLAIKAPCCGRQADPESAIALSAWLA
jgi:hypothetical protein